MGDGESVCFCSKALGRVQKKRVDEGRLFARIFTKHEKQDRLEGLDWGTKCEIIRRCCGSYDRMLWKRGGFKD